MTGLYSNLANKNGRASCSVELLVSKVTVAISFNGHHTHAPSRERVSVRTVELKSS